MWILCIHMDIKMWISDLHGKDGQHDKVISNFSLDGHGSIGVRIIIGEG